MYSACQKSRESITSVNWCEASFKNTKGDPIDRLHSLGMSISYDEVLGLSSDMANAVCEHFKETDTVYPPNLKTNVSLQPQLIISSTTRRRQRQ